jgi:hypothetical protein
MTGRDLLILGLMVLGTVATGWSINVLHEDAHDRQ